MSREPWFPALTFAEVSKQNRARACRWHPGFPAHDSWNGADWSNALNGEAGEAANIVKKLRRHETGHHGALDGDESQLLADLGDELADVFLYLDLLAAKYGIDLTAHIVEKFNVVSERQGFPERLGSANSHSEARRTEQALASWQQLAEAQERELGLYRHAARLATDALDRHKLWCGYRRDAPGDSSFYDAERALSRAANSHSEPT